MRITSYYIDDNYVMHTYIGNEKHITISNVFTDNDAEELINQINNQLN
jgi:hypothetical protein